MNKVMQQFNISKPVGSLLPQIGTMIGKTLDNVEFRNLTHFVNTVSKLTQKKDGKCGITYAEALKDLQKRVPTITPKKQESIRNLVRSNLHKRGMITQEVYEEFKYATDGVQIGVDVGRYTAGEPECVITPTKQYINFFYELFISISYSYGVTNEEVVKNVAKLLATIEELERQHIFIKITLVFPDRNPAEGRNFFSSIPLFHHREFKDVGLMSSVLNERLLRKFYFAILEATYGNNLRKNYGYVEELEGVMNIGDKFSEIEFFETIQKEVGAT